MRRNSADMLRNFRFSLKNVPFATRKKQETKSENIVRRSCNKYRPRILTMNESLKKVNRVTTQFLDAHFQNDE